ncbi:MAG TPA: VIT1/CCC1 transporter family protein, partial [Gemmatimonadaceae bacterium]
RELATMPDLELAELTAIYVGRGLTPELARKVAEQFTAKDALAAHARDELGLHELTRARPIQAALSSAAAFAAGAATPLILVIAVPLAQLTSVVMGVSLVLLFGLGLLAARLGGAPMVRGAARVAFWGVVAMVATALVGRLFGTVV